MLSILSQKPLALVYIYPVSLSSLHSV